jgi:hypothetical protein
MTKSPRLIGIEFGYGFDPEHGVPFAIGVQLCNLSRNPVRTASERASGTTRRNSRKPALRRRARINFIRSAGSAISFPVIMRHAM